MSNKIGLPKDFELAEGTELDHNPPWKRYLRGVIQSAGFASIALLPMISPYIVGYNPNIELSERGGIALASVLLGVAGNFIGRRQNLSLNILGVSAVVAAGKLTLGNIPPLDNVNTTNFLLLAPAVWGLIDGYTNNGEIGPGLILGGLKWLANKVANRVENNLNERRNYE